MADVEITYNNSAIVTMSSSGTEILETEGTFLTDDITIEYTKPTPTLQSKSVNPTESAQTVTADSGYDGLSQVTVNAMPSGFAGTPTVTKGTVTNHSVSVTPSVTNTSGYISGGTINGTAVTVSASELVSGTKSITENGTGIDVANYAAVDVNVTGGGEIYRGEHHSGARIVGISLTNPVNPSDFSSCTIYEAPTSDILDLGNQIGSIDSPTGSTQVNVSASLFGIIIVCNGSYVASGTSSCMGNVQFVESDYEGTELYSVNGSGTITIDGIDYDD